MYITCICTTSAYIHVFNDYVHAQKRIKLQCRYTLLPATSPTTRPFHPNLSCDPVQRSFPKSLKSTVELICGIRNWTATCTYTCTCVLSLLLTGSLTLLICVHAHVCVHARASGTYIHVHMYIYTCTCISIYKCSLDWWQCSSQSHLHFLFR